MSFINASVAQNIDNELMRKPGFSIDQLMELAGLSVAQSFAHFSSGGKRVLIFAGPGNNGGTGRKVRVEFACQNNGIRQFLVCISF